MVCIIFNTWYAVKNPIRCSQCGSNAQCLLHLPQCPGLSFLSFSDLCFVPCYEFIFVTRIFYTAEDIAGRGLLRKERKERKNEQTAIISVEMKSSWTKMMYNQSFICLDDKLLINFKWSFFSGSATARVVRPPSAIPNMSMEPVKVVSIQRRSPDTTYL